MPSGEVSADRAWYVFRADAVVQTEIQIDANNNYYEVSTYSTATPVAGPGPTSVQMEKKKALEKAEINLNDCLACR